MSGVACLKPLTNSMKSVLAESWAVSACINVSVFPQTAEDEAQNFQQCSRGASQDLGKAVVGTGPELKVTRAPSLSKDVTSDKESHRML